MKKYILISFIAIAALVPLGAKAVFVSADTAYFDILYTKVVQSEIEIGYRAGDEIAVSVPLRLTVPLDKRNLNRMMDFALVMRYYPIEKCDLFVSMSLFHMGRIFSRGYVERDLVYLNEISLGWTFTLDCGLLIEPRISVRDPSGVYGDSYDAVRKAIGIYPDVRFSIAIGYDWRLYV